jgi:transcriptional regulator with XRE-family HTH domain
MESMKKEKLYYVRKRKGYSQQQMSDFLNMDVSNYQRRESGEKSISGDEWQKLAEVLDVPLGEIFESEEKQVFIFKDNAQNNHGISNNYAVPEYLLEHQRKYIIKLEEEIEQLRIRLDIDTNKQD